MRGEIRLTQRPTGEWLVSYAVDGIVWWLVQCRTEDEAMARIAEVRAEEEGRS